MNLDLLPAEPFQTVGYGMTSFPMLAQRALARWNAVGIGQTPDFFFFAVRQPTVSGDPCAPDGINEVRFASTICGMGWGSAVGITLIRSVGGRVVETDVLFRSTVPMNAYPGPLLSAGGGGTLLDFYRLALHEFGHAAGLRHPDEAGQTVFAVMNSHIDAPNAADELQPDDAAGVHAVSWIAPSVPLRFSPLDDKITELFDEILVRRPTTAELAAWRFHVLANPTPAGMAIFGHALFDGGEYLNRSSTPRDYVTLLYRSILDREPDPAGLQGWLQYLQGQFDTALPGFVNSPEFQRLVPSTRDQSAVRAVVTRLYQQVLGRQPAPAEVTEWADYVVATGDLLGVARGFFGSAEYNSQPRTLSQHVVILYRAFLGREPAPQEIEPWVNYLQFFRVGVEDTFINSVEFQSQLPSFF